jgi:hypothetical protein
MRAANGKVQMISTWGIGRRRQLGTLTPTGGTLSGTLSWQGPEDGVRGRSCHIVLVACSTFATSRDKAIGKKQMSHSVRSMSAYFRKLTPGRTITLRTQSVPRYRPCGNKFALH